MIQQNETQLDELKNCIYARKNIFRLARLLQECLFFLHDEEELKAATLRLLLSDLERSATSGYLDALPDSDEPCVVLHGEEANWLWLRDQAEICRLLDADDAIEELLSICDRLLRQCSSVEDEPEEHAQEILAHLENRFSLLSKVVGSNGIFLLAFPNFRGAEFPVSCETQEDRYGGVSCKTLIMPDVENAPDDWVYTAAANTLIQWLDLPDELGPQELTLLEEHWDPEIGSAEPGEQLEALCCAISAGLASSGPYGEETCADHSRRQCAWWEDYILQQIETVYPEKRREFLCVQI